MRFVLAVSLPLSINAELLHMGNCSTYPLPKHENKMNSFFPPNRTWLHEGLCFEVNLHALYRKSSEHHLYLLQTQRSRSKKLHEECKSRCIFFNASYYLLDQNRAENKSLSFQVK